MDTGMASAANAIRRDSWLQLPFKSCFWHFHWAFAAVSRPTRDRCGFVSQAGRRSKTTQRRPSLLLSFPVLVAQPICPLPRAAKHAALFSGSGALVANHPVPLPFLNGPKYIPRLFPYDKAAGQTSIHHTIVARILVVLPASKR